MNPIDQASFFALQFVFDIAVFFFVLRFALRAVHARPQSPFVQGIANITNPLCRPVSRFIPYHHRWDMTALTWAFVLQAVYYALMAMLLGQDYSAIGLGLLTVSDLLRAFLNLWFLTIIAEAILSFFRPVQTDPGLYFIAELNQPILKPLRKLLPNFGGIDLSPIVALFVIKLTEILIVGSLQNLAKTWL